mmetsp:Transcript_34641/g.83119  ORF Transcript_34641/g.83119 Transcript_34641/m.83119 type:complete len:254 (+) Transcript_34641:3785-4546(+)
MPVVHAHPQPCLHALDGGTEAPLRHRVDIAADAMRHREDVLAEADDSRLEVQAVLVVALQDLVLVEALQHHGHLEGLPRVAAHVGVHHLNEVALGEAQRAQLVARLALCQVPHRADQQPPGARQHVHHLNGPTGAGSAVLDEHAGMLETDLCPGITGREAHVRIHHLLQLGVALAAHEVDADKEGAARVLGHHVVHVAVALGDVGLLQPRQTAVHGAVGEHGRVLVHHLLHRVEAPGPEALQAFDVGLAPQPT